MKSKDSIKLINSLHDPFNTRLDIEVCDKFGHVLRKGNRPILRFRGGELGKLISSIDPNTKTYMGEGDHSHGSTYCAFSLNDGIGYALRRSIVDSGGGRYNPVTGEQMKQYNYGFPFVIAIDIRRKIKENSMSFSQSRPGEIVANDPIELRDIVLLYGFRPNLVNPLDKTEFVNHLSRIEGSFRNQSYIELLQRQHDAMLEDAVVENPELLS
jgi:hypothetical protein